MGPDSRPKGGQSPKAISSNISASKSKAPFHSIPHSLSSEDSGDMRDFPSYKSLPTSRYQLEAFIKLKFIVMYLATYCIKQYDTLRNKAGPIPHSTLNHTNWILSQRLKGRFFMTLMTLKHHGLLLTWASAKYFAFENLQKLLEQWRNKFGKTF